MYQFCSSLCQTGNVESSASIRCGEYLALICWNIWALQLLADVTHTGANGAFDGDKPQIWGFSISSRRTCSWLRHSQIYWTPTTLQCYMFKWHISNSLTCEMWRCPFPIIQLVLFILSEYFTMQHPRTLTPKERRFIEIQIYVRRAKNEK